MAKDRFVEVYSLGSHDLGAGAGLTVLVDQNGKPVITPIQ